MANWHFGRARNWYLNFGPYAGFLLNSSQPINSEENIKDAFNTTDFGFSLGIGVKFRLSDKVKLFLEDDEQGGFTNVLRNSPGTTVQNIRSSINIGLLFPLK